MSPVYAAPGKMREGIGLDDLRRDLNQRFLAIGHELKRLDAFERGDHVFNVKHPRFGAVGDGLTDDTDAIQRAIDAASDAGGGHVVLPRGTYLVSEMIVVPHKVQFRGLGGWDGVKILADSAFDFGTYTAVLSIGEPSVIAFGAVISDLMVDCASVASSIGVYVASGNEASGCERVHVTKPMLYGFQVDASNSAVPQNYFLRDISVGIASTATAATAIGVLISGGSADHRGIDGVTIDVSPSGSLGAGSIGLSLNGMGGLVSRVHVEDVETGIDIGPVQACTGLHVTGVTGASTVTNLVRINNATASQNVVLTGLRRNSGTNILVDEISSITKTSSDLALYVLGAGSPQPVIQADGVTGPWSISGALSLASVLGFTAAGTTTAGAQLWRSAVNGLAQRGIAGSTYDWAVLNAGATAAVLGNRTGTLHMDFAGSPVFTRRAFAEDDATPSVAAGSYFVTANANATTITDFDDGVTGQQIIVEIGDANTTVDFTSSGLRGNAGVDWSPTTGDHMRCVYNGTDWLCEVSDNTA